MYGGARMIFSSIAVCIEDRFVRKVTSLSAHLEQWELGASYIVASVNGDLKLIHRRH